MLVTNIGLVQKYDYLEEKFEKGYEFLKKKDLKALPLGCADIDGDEVFALMQEYTIIPADACKYESHNRYFDIQHVVEDQEQFGCVRRAGLLEGTPYNEVDDIVSLGNRSRAGSSSRGLGTAPRWPLRTPTNPDALQARPVRCIRL